MRAVSKRGILVISLFTALVMVSALPVTNVVASDFPSDLNVGPHIEQVFYDVISQEDQRVLALQNGAVDIIARVVDPLHLPTLREAADISLTSTLRNGYGHFTINCGKYPLNISAFRRAFAYAFDKTRVTSEIFDGLSKEQDSVVPYVNTWCVEDDLPYHYYTAQVDTGNAILDKAGFTIDTESGYRLAPDGSFFQVFIEFPVGSPEVTAITSGVSLIGVDALQSLRILANATPVNFNDMLTRISNNEDFDIAFYAYDFYDYDVDWLALNFWGELANVPYENPSNFRNATYDSWRQQLLYATGFDEVYEAAAAMQLILHENVPMVIAYENIFMQAHRDDTFAGFIEDLGRGIEGTWTLRRIHRIDTVLGGTLRIAIPDEPDTFNIFINSNSIAASMMAELWSSLYLRGPDLRPRYYLARHLLTETHSDNPSVQSGRIRFTIDMIQNATWNDGTPITAEDVVFSFKYSLESGFHGNPAGRGLTNLVAVFAPSTYRAVLEFETETYWHFSRFAYNYIIPKHIFNDVDGIGYEKWNSWDPVFWNTSLILPTSGPFELSEYVPGEFIVFDVNPDFCYFPEAWMTAPSHLLFANPILQTSEVGSISGILFVCTIMNRRKSA